jgi:hypothetical protein
MAGCVFLRINRTAEPVDTRDRWFLSGGDREAWLGGAMARGSRYLRWGGDARRAHLESRSQEMTLCPIALVIGCKKCPVFAICPLKGVIGDYKKEDAPGTKPPADKAKS